MTTVCDICGSEDVYSYSDLHLLEAPLIYCRSHYCEACHKRIFDMIRSMKEAKE